MNEYSKEVLYHSWGKTPDRKKLEREYNKSYYQKNKHKWGIKSAAEPLSIKKKSPAQTALNAYGNAMMLVPGMAYLYGSGENFAGYVSDTASTVASIVEANANTPVESDPEPSEPSAFQKAVEKGKKIAKKIFSSVKKLGDAQFWYDWAHKD